MSEIDNVGKPQEYTVFCAMVGGEPTVVYQPVNPAQSSQGLIDQLDQLDEIALRDADAMTERLRASLGDKISLNPAELFQRSSVFSEKAIQISATSFSGRAILGDSEPKTMRQYMGAMKQVMGIASDKRKAPGFLSAMAAVTDTVFSASHVQKKVAVANARLAKNARFTISNELGLLAMEQEGPKGWVNVSKRPSLAVNLAKRRDAISGDASPEMTSSPSA